MTLSRLTKVDLREAWPHEAADFTSWLSEDENLRLLSDEIGIDISLVNFLGSSLANQHIGRVPTSHTIIPQGPALAKICSLQSSGRVSRVAER